MATRRGRAFWERLSAEVDRGATVAAVARRHRVKERTLSWWRWRLRREDSKLEAEPPATPAFLPVVVDEVSAQARVIEAVVSDVVIRAEVGTDLEYLASLLRALRRQC